MAVERKKFGRYELVRTLGVGGMAQAFMALRFFRIGDDEVSRPVCLKQVLPIYNNDEDFLHLFHREAKLAIQLQHPNIVKVQDFGQVEGVHFMELELVDGVDLLTLLQSQGGRLPTAVIKQLALDIAAALHYAHNHVPQDLGAGVTPGRRGIIHRDISPSNILISKRGDIKLTDFGIAKALSGSATAKASRAPLGKLPYMAPERFNRKLPTDGRADLFSLGIVLFECAGGLRPYDGEDDSETIGNIIAGAPRSLLAEAPDMDEPLCEVIEKLITPQLDERTSDAAELIEQLHEIAPSPRTRIKLARMVEEALARRGPIDKTPTSGTAALPSDTQISVANPGAQTSAEGDLVALQIRATVDGTEAVTYKATNLPTGLVIEPGTGRISGTVSRLSAGDYEVSVTAESGTVVSTTQFAWTIVAPAVSSPPSGPPSGSPPGSPPGPQPGLRGWESEPAGNPSKRRLILAALAVLLLGGLGLLLYFIIPGPGPSGPTVRNPGPQTNTAGERISLEIVAEDPEVDSLTYSTRDLPPGLAINRRGVIAGKVASKDAGLYTVTVSVDNGSETSREQFDWTIVERAVLLDASVPSAPDASVPSQPDASVPPPTSHGWVKVVVIPWGTAWIDGQRFSPGSNGFMRVREGLHVVKAGRGALSDAPARRRIRVRAGRRIRVDMELPN